MKPYLQINESKSTLEAPERHTLSHTPSHTVSSHAAQYRRHSKRVVQQRAYKTVSNMAVGWTLALTCIIMNAHTPRRFMRE